jgi:hypothetical protein
MQKKLFLNEKIILLFTLIAIVSFTGACSEDPIAPQEEHVKAIGMVFYSSGIEVARISKGVTEDTLKVPLGGLSDHFDIKLIGEDEKEFDPPSTDSQYLSWEFGDPLVADIWQHEGEEGSFAFHLKGLQSGETSVEFFVMHNDHSDFRSGKIPVKIESQEDFHGEPIGLELSDEESGDVLVTINESEIFGQLNVKSSDTTDHIEVKFFDENIIHFQPAVPPHSLLVEVEDESIVSIVGQEADEPWAFKIAGLKTGSTTITIKLMHDESVGVSFEPITIIVN